MGRHWGDNMPDNFRHSVDTQASRKIGDSTIGEDLRITGNVSSKGEIHLDGEVHGDVSCVALVLGESATLEGNVTAEDVVIRGRLIGSVRGLRVTLQSMSMSRATSIIKVSRSSRVPISRADRAVPTILWVSAALLPPTARQPRSQSPPRPPSPPAIAKDKPTHKFTRSLPESRSA